MRILILANLDVGLYRFRKDLIKQLQEKNEVFLSVPKGEYQQYFEGIGCKYIDTYIDRRGMNPITDIKLYFQYRKLLKKIKPDLVITYTIKCNIYGGMAAKISKVPYAVNITGLGSAFQNDGLLKKLVTTMYKIALSKVKTVFFENSYNKQVFLDSKIITEDKCTLLNGAGVNLDDYIILQPNNLESTNFLFIGRIMKEKGVEELFAVAQKCKENGINARFDFIGGYEDNYKDVVEKLGENNIINYYGFQSDIVPFVQQSDAVILPSYHEGMSNALLEGAAMGKALLASDIPGCKETIIDGVSGYTFKKADVDDLYEKVVQFVNLPKEEKIEMGQAGRKHMEDVFDKKKVVSDTIEALMK